MKAKTIIIGGVGVGALAALYFYFKNKPVTPTQTTAVQKTVVPVLQKTATPPVLSQTAQTFVNKVEPVKFLETPIVKVIEQKAPPQIFESAHDLFIKSIANTLNY